MTQRQAIADLLACPRCGTSLDALRCKACQVTFPELDGVPWLFADPGAAVSEWRNRWQLAVERLRQDGRRVQCAVAEGKVQSTRHRLDVLARGCQAQERHLATLLAPLEKASGSSLETLLALRTRLPPSQGVFSYEANVHRDWFWGEGECAQARDAVLAALAGRTPQRTLVLGAGAGRLAYDLHQSTAAVTTVAVDLNPLLVYVGARVSRGEPVSLVEFPLAPRTPENAAIERTLTAPCPARSGLHFVLADVLRAPFRPGSFDLVVTPWLLDVIEERPDRMLGRINVLLADGGCWINQGSVAFAAADPTWRLTLEELLALATGCGFTEVEADEQRVPYMDCPDSRYGRMESVVTSRARKCAEAGALPRQDSLPEWIVEGRQPVPLSPAFKTQAMTTRMHAFLMSLIDGKRSLQDIARILEEQRLMPRREAEVAMRGFLTQMHDEAQRS